jgi:hypothetical protein
MVALEEDIDRLVQWDNEDVGLLEMEGILAVCYRTQGVGDLGEKWLIVSRHNDEILVNEEMANGLAIPVPVRALMYAEMV